MENQGMETGNPGFAGPAGFQGRQLRAVILAFTILDAVSALGSSSSSSILPRFSKADKGDSGVVLPSHGSYTGCCCRHLYNLLVPGLPIQCTTVSQLAARFLFSKYCCNAHTGELQDTYAESDPHAAMLALLKPGGCKLVLVPAPCHHRARNCTYLARPRAEQVSLVPTHLWPSM